MPLKGVPDVPVRKILIYNDKMASGRSGARTGTSPIKPLILSDIFLNGDVSIIVNVPVPRDCGVVVFTTLAPIGILTV